MATPEVTIEGEGPETPLRERVYAVVRAIPRGCVATYGQVARLAGAPRAARFVGQALHRNPEPIVTPCHRVVFADGSLAEHFGFGGCQMQRELLEGEDVPFLDATHVDLAACRWDA